MSNSMSMPPPLPTALSVSRGLAGWMLQNRCSLAFTSYQTGQLFLVGTTPAGVVSFHQQNFQRAMGVHARPGRLYLGALHQIWRLENVLGPAQLANDHHDRLFVPRNAQTVGDVDIHEVAVDRGGRLVFVNTKYSCLATVSPVHGFQPLWKPSFISRLAPEDRCHLNGLAMEDEAPAYVSAVSRSDVLTGWRSRRHEGGVVIDVRTDRIVTDQLSMPHSPRIHDGQLWALDSGRGYLIRIDRQTGATENVAFCPGFLRGLAFHGPFAMVTVSLPRHEGTFTGLDLADTLSAKDSDPWCGVFIIDTRTGDTVEWIRLEGAITELFDIAALPGVACPMAVGIDSPDMQTMITFDPEFGPLAPA
ncbi:TIGR03032 family protein [Caulobacter sp. SLTY]|uniref:TIGR03032 family protein n=1 Tax=Caulobacter sp. SLTY TaxID=2683262 RepID=UPI001412CA66|nr:TIGR03032 family protein [Caulobacter sp. SLTY]NBB15861.1 TIGR03032 family protein [Caulobacter sp. SLTY]